MAFRCAVQPELRAFGRRATRRQFFMRGSLQDVFDSLGRSAASASAHLVAASAVSGVLLLLVALSLLPGPIGALHALIVFGAVLVGAASWAYTLAIQAQRDEDGSPKLKQLRALDDRLDRRTENLRDLCWQVSDRESRYRQLLDAQSDLILRVDIDRRVTFVNSAYCALFEVASENVLGRPLSSNVLSDEVSILDAPRDLGDRETATPEGSRWLSWQLHKLPIGEQGQIEFELVGRDITDERAQRERLDEAREQAEAASRAKSRFLAAMSHEIRTPMNGILGMARLLSDGELSDEQRTYVNAINDSAGNLLLLVNEILDFSKIEAGKLALREHRFSIEDSVQATVELLAPRAHEKNLELAWLVAPDVPREVIGDEARVRQVLLNLLSNAIKFTDSGGIVVSVEAGGYEPGPEGAGQKQHILFSVKDTGVGMTEEERDKLFEEFEQSSSDLDHKPQGTGLGLAISRNLALAMDGTIKVDSAVAEGSTFVADLVLRRVDDEESCGDRATPRTAGLQPHVLLAMDRAMERAVMARILAASGARVVEATFAGALQKLEEGSVDAKFDRVVVEVENDPAEAAMLLREATRPKKDAVGIVIIDADSRQRQSEFHAAGFERYVVRPFRAKSLVEQVIQSRGQLSCADQRVRDEDKGQEARPSDPAVQQPQRVVLIVEDNAINELLAVQVVKRAGHKVLTARSGVDAVEHMRLALRGEARMPDAILMDILMPGISGVEASRLIKAMCADANTQCPPVIALTAHAFAEDRQRYLDAGLDDYLTKPFVPVDLHHVLDRAFAKAPSKRGNVA